MANKSAARPGEGEKEESGVRKGRMIGGGKVVLRPGYASAPAGTSKPEQAETEQRAGKADHQNKEHIGVGGGV